MKQKKIDVSIIIPAYNEETNIRLGALDQVGRYLEKQRYLWEVILVDDGSTDATSFLLDAFAKTNGFFRVMHNVHQGKAASVISGMLAANGEIVVFTDLDQATPIRELEKILPWFEKKFDVVIGSRNTKREGAPVLRFFMARAFMIIRSMILGLDDITDTQCGFKAFRKLAALGIFDKLKLYGVRHQAVGSSVTAGFDLEVLFLAKALGFPIKEVPVEWHYVETRRVNPLLDSWQGFWDIVNIRINALKGAYN